MDFRSLTLGSYFWKSWPSYIGSTSLTTQWLRREKKMISASLIQVFHLKTGVLKCKSHYLLMSDFAKYVYLILIVKTVFYCKNERKRGGKNVFICTFWSLKILFPSLGLFFLHKMQALFNRDLGLFILHSCTSLSLFPCGFTSIFLWQTIRTWGKVLETKKLKEHS